MTPLTLKGSDWNPELDLEPLESRIITAEGFRSGTVLMTDPFLIRYLDEHPDDIRSLTPREFETLIAGLLAKSGYAVALGPLGADGGVDVFAERRGELGTELTLVQCKRHRGSNKVTEPIVKQFYADVTLRNATRGLLVTTSTFTAPALKLIEDVRYRLAGKDFRQLREWLKYLRRGFSS